MDDKITSIEIRAVDPYIKENTYPIAFEFLLEATDDTYEKFIDKTDLYELSGKKDFNDLLYDDNTAVYLYASITEDGKTLVDMTYSDYGNGKEFLFEIPLDKNEQELIYNAVKDSYDKENPQEPVSKLFKDRKAEIIQDFAESINAFKAQTYNAENYSHKLAIKIEAYMFEHGCKTPWTDSKDREATVSDIRDALNHDINSLLDYFKKECYIQSDQSELHSDTLEIVTVLEEQSSLMNISDYMAALGYLNEGEKIESFECFDFDFDFHLEAYDGRGQVDIEETISILSDNTREDADTFLNNYYELQVHVDSSGKGEVVPYMRSNETGEVVSWDDICDMLAGGIPENIAVTEYIDGRFSYEYGREYDERETELGVICDNIDEVMDEQYAATKEWLDTEMAGAFAKAAEQGKDPSKLIRKHNSEAKKKEVVDLTF